MLGMELGQKEIFKTIAYDIFCVAAKLSISRGSSKVCINNRWWKTF
jgi:hypothetical protein